MSRCRIKARSQHVRVSKRNDRTELEWARSERRHFSAEYKARILAEADACAERGQIGALLRREGLYSSHLDKWRKQRGRRTRLA